MYQPTCKPHDSSNAKAFGMAVARPRSLPGVYDGPSVEASLVARTPPAPDQGKPEVLHRLRQPAALWSKPGQETGHSDIDGDASSSDAEQDGALHCRIPPLDAVVIDNLKAKAAIVISATPLVERLLKEAKADFDRVASGHQVKTNDQLAVIYNDAMPLEEHHAAAALGLGIPILIAALLRDGCQPRRQHYERPCLRRSSAAGRHGISVQPSACAERHGPGMTSAQAGLMEVIGWPLFVAKPDRWDRC
ncbi:hypothetical protein WJX84_010701 [Apatococcus fuscideae]|uniref:Uncharacterized protein n=1 Tax=Apatococcus fuscideae TaxID=2026836 RepID=A0AAW1S9E1_9CHLO